ncbi:MAG: phosphoribosylformylglycinamidine synthase subunit PurS [Rhodothermales bacterium]
MYKATLSITLRPSILDPQGKATRHALADLGFNGVEEVRIGKYIEMLIDADSSEDATFIAAQACEKLLANPVMEDYTVDVTAVEVA